MKHSRNLIKTDMLLSVFNYTPNIILMSTWIAKEVQKFSKSRDLNSTQVGQSVRNLICKTSSRRSKSKVENLSISLNLTALFDISWLSLHIAEFTHPKVEPNHEVLEHKLIWNRKSKFMIILIQITTKSYSSFLGPQV